MGNVINSRKNSSGMLKMNISINIPKYQKVKNKLVVAHSCM